MALVCDTGPLLAALDRDDPDHARCSQLLETTLEDLVIPTLVLGELDYWCRKLAIEESMLALLEDIESGVWRLEHPSLADLIRCRELNLQYRDLGLGLVDASVIALAERLEESKVASLDHRHFSTVRPRHVTGLRLVPDRP